MNFKMIALASTCILATSGSFAQTATTTETPTITAPNSSNPEAPVKGENSFTEAQAKERMEGAGFSNVSALVLDDDGIWEASAQKNGAHVTLKLDYQGNITFE